MKIAFVGKGGSGKTTMAALFTQYCSKSQTVWAIDADINMHLSEQLGVQTQSEKQLSQPEVELAIKNFLIGKNDRIVTPAHFKKTTPPATGSNLIRINENNFVIQNFTAHKDNLWLSVVGSYQTNGIGTSCYHNNLAILENILSHTVDTDVTIVVDMVAGTDAFAGSLHAQFDAVVLVVEPTLKSLSVLQQFQELAAAANIGEQVYVVGNKVSDEHDRRFIEQHVDTNKLIGYLPNSPHIKAVEQQGITLDIQQLADHSVFEKLQQRLVAIPANIKLQKLYQLHRKYIAQAHVKDRFGDLSQQIDSDFNFENYAANYA